MPRPEVLVKDIRRGGDFVLFSVSANSYAHAVHFGLEDSIRLSDEYFDLYRDFSPGQQALH